jgi:hypothetical protein
MMCPEEGLDTNENASRCRETRPHPLLRLELLGSCTGDARDVRESYSKKVNCNGPIAEFFRVEPGAVPNATPLDPNFPRGFKRISPRGPATVVALLRGGLRLEGLGHQSPLRGLPGQRLPESFRPLLRLPLRLRPGHSPYLCRRPLLWHHGHVGVADVESHRPLWWLLPSKPRGMNPLPFRIRCCLSRRRLLSRRAFGPCRLAGHLPRAQRSSPWGSGFRSLLLELPVGLLFDEGHDLLDQVVGAAAELCGAWPTRRMRGSPRSGAPRNRG